MAIYAIGDIQGCYDELIDILDLINFDEKNDRLWFTGDLVNRGPQSLAVLRFVKQLGNIAITVQGNHDLHLLAIANGQPQYLKPADTLDEILSAPDREELLDWLRYLPLFHRDDEAGFILVHAGLPPQWSTRSAGQYAKEVESALRGDNHMEFFANMYGNEPRTWSDNLVGWDRIRIITNCLTRIRFCDENGKLVFKYKGPPGTQKEKFQPWFEIKKRKSRAEKIIFGHWASLRDYQRDFKNQNVYPLDMGCVWGGNLVALRLEDEKTFSVPSRQVRTF